jgi:hypothetical protein
MPLRSRRSRLEEQRRSPSAVLNRNFCAATFAGVMDEFNGGSSHVGDFCPGAGDKLDRRIIVFDDAMRGDELVDDHEADRIGLDRRNNCFDDRPGNAGASFRLLGDDDFRLAPGVDVFR